MITFFSQSFYTNNPKQWYLMLQSPQEQSHPVLAIPNNSTHFYDHFLFTITLNTDNPKQHYSIPRSPPFQKQSHPALSIPNNSTNFHEYTLSTDNLHQRYSHFHPPFLFQKHYSVCIQYPPTNPIKIILFGSLPADVLVKPSSFRRIKCTATLVTTESCLSQQRGSVGGRGAGVNPRGQEDRSSRMQTPRSNVPLLSRIVFDSGEYVACYINWTHRDTRERAADTDLRAGVL